MATKKPGKDKPAKKRGQDIPLENIPDRTRRMHTPEFKKSVADRAIAGESMERLAEEFDIARSLVSSWTEKVRKGIPLNVHGGARNPKAPATDNVALMLRQSLARAMAARDERLEAAAAIVEADGANKAIAEQIRKLKRPAS